MKKTTLLKQTIEFLKALLLEAEEQEERDFQARKQLYRRKNTPQKVSEEKRSIFTQNIHVVDAVLIDDNSDVFRIIPGTCSSCAFFNNDRCTHPLCMRYGKDMGKIRCFEYAGKFKDNKDKLFLFTETQKNETANEKIISEVEN